MLTSIQLKTVTGHAVDLRVDRRATVADVKQALVSEFHYAPGVSLMYQGKVLRDDVAIESYPYGAVLILGQKSRKGCSPTTSPQRRADVSPQRPQQQQHQQSGGDNSSYYNHIPSPQGLDGSASSNRRTAYGGGGGGSTSTPPSPASPQPSPATPASPQSRSTPFQQPPPPPGWNTRSGAGGGASPHDVRVEPESPSAHNGAGGQDSMTVFCMVPATNQRVPVVLPAKGSTFGDLQRLFAEQLPSIAPGARFIFRGKLLTKPTEVLWNYGVHDLDVVHVAGGAISNPEIVMLLQVKEEYDRIQEKLADSATTPLQRNFLNEEMMKLLYRLDGLMEIPQEYKQQRKDLVKAIMARQDELQQQHQQQQQQQR